MYPIIAEFRLPFIDSPFRIYSYGLMILVGVACCYFYASSQFKKLNISADSVWNLIMVVIAAAFVGGKLFLFLENPEQQLNENFQAFFSGTGFVFYGSVFCAIPAIYFYLKHIKAPIPISLDIIAVCGALVQGFGRIGCFLAGCCHGKQCPKAFGMIYTDPNSAAPLNVPLYPTQIIEATWLFALALGLAMYSKRKQFDGQIFAIYIGLNAFVRFFIEYLRGDDERGFLLGGLLSHSQLFALVLIGFAIVSLFRFNKKTSN
jgi:phosphatidylglycerol---prolipoprotein diacylglyceryl transferase